MGRRRGGLRATSGVRECGSCCFWQNGQSFHNQRGNAHSDHMFIARERILNFESQTAPRGRFRSLLFPRPHLPGPFGSDHIGSGPHRFNFGAYTVHTLFVPRCDIANNGRRSGRDPNLFLHSLRWLGYPDFTRFNRRLLECGVRDGPQIGVWFDSDSGDLRVI